MVYVFNKITNTITMNCIINKVITQYQAKGKKLEVIKRYLLMKYHINMDMASLKERIKASRLNYEMR